MIVVLLGIFPPPVTGAAKNNLLLHQRLTALEVESVMIPTSPGGLALSRSLKYHLQRVWHFYKSVAALFAVTKIRGSRRLYFVPDGGLGAWYSLGYIIITRWMFFDIVLHHRTFYYIDHHSFAIRMICRLIKDKVLHVFLSDGMRLSFQAQYGTQESLISTNARYISPRSPEKPQNEFVIGHLSNLCKAKGYFEVVDTYEQLRAKGLNVRLLLAGPVVDKEVEDHLAQLLEIGSDSIEYYGSVSGSEKDDFYDRLHLFLFPTKWAQEAQPNVLYEAMAGGAAVAAFNRGCIGEMIFPECGLLVPQSADFAKMAANYAEQISCNLQQITKTVNSCIKSEKNSSVRQFNTLEQRLISGAPVTSTLRNERND